MVVVTFAPAAEPLSGSARTAAPTKPEGLWPVSQSSPERATLTSGFSASTTARPAAKVTGPAGAAAEAPARRASSAARATRARRGSRRAAASTGREELITLAPSSGGAVVGLR
jgi:hypothetical protein